MLLFVRGTKPVLKLNKVIKTLGPSPTQDSLALGLLCCPFFHCSKLMGVLFSKRKSCQVTDIGPCTSGCVIPTEVLSFRTALQKQLLSGLHLGACADLHLVKVLFRLA